MKADNLKLKGIVMRPERGHFISELPVLLLILFMVFAFPLIDLAVMGCKAMLVKTVIRHAAEEAAKAKSFNEDLEVEEGRLLSAKHVARDIVFENIGAPGKVTRADGVKLNGMVTRIVIVPFDQNERVVKSNRPLVNNRNQIKSMLSTGTYNIEVEARTEIEPLIKLPRKIFGNVPGLTTSFSLVEAHQAYCEHPEGLFR